MNPRRKAQVLTIALMALLGALLVARQTGWTPPDAAAVLAPAPPKPDPTPQDALYAMLDAAREGNVAAYLSYYTGAMGVSLRQTIGEQGEAAFARYLRETNAPIKGVAINEPQPLAAGEVKARVEYVYQDRNEAQVFYLEREPGRQWRITRLDPAERVKTLVPYGTPVQ